MTVENNILIHCLAFKTHKLIKIANNFIVNRLTLQIPSNNSLNKAGF